MNDADTKTKKASPMAELRAAAQEAISTLRTLNAKPTADRLADALKRTNVLE